MTTSCEHTWSQLNIVIDCYVSGTTEQPGERFPIPNRASCSQCGCEWELDGVQSAGARAFLDGRYTAKEPA